MEILILLGIGYLLVAVWFIVDTWDDMKFGGKAAIVIGLAWPLIVGVLLYAVVVNWFRK